ncbi:LPXTG cell wall anchor domain-containing protein [Actinoplanes sp. ATCC 53533]|uniref:LPXTG cell wall anchor domain-containing protein n=1 Tax=Actinoplanes sp. ATCC 53533 TaxID=1288362 RepID=UPI0013159954|nr:LPXTG cell wall anchor domain-containing protein [Actinoplanes sp. ATCC 53533]
MGLNLLGRFAVAAGAAVMVGSVTGSPALADSTVAVNGGNVPTTASAYGTHDCDANFGGGPYPGSDIWVFVLPGNHDKVGDFVSVTAVFGANGTLTVPADGGAVVTDKGTSKAWIKTPAGWTLTGAAAVITGTADKFNLTHTCPAGGGQTTPPTPVVTEPTPVVSASTGSPAPTGGSGSGTGSSTGDSTGGTAGGGSGGLPVTGTAVTGLATLGGALVAGGIVLLILRRRRGELVFSAEGESPDRGRV